MKRGQGPLSLGLDIYLYTFSMKDSMATHDSSHSEADRMAQGACDGAGAMGPDYVFSGGTNARTAWAQSAEGAQQ